MDVNPEIRTLLREARLTDAIATAQDAVRKDPSAAAHRIVLFELLCLTGKWDKAITQLNVAADLDANFTLVAQMLRPALNCEALRQDIFAGARTPLIFGEPEEWLGLMVEALRLSAQGHVQQAQDLRARALELAPASPGLADDKPFEWIADMDSRLGPILEAIVSGKYYWVPLHHLKGVDIEPPTEARDLVWINAKLRVVNGGDAHALIPVRYVRTEDNADPRVLLARATHWLDDGHEHFRGQGQRTLATDADEFGILDIRRLEFKR